VGWGDGGTTHCSRFGVSKMPDRFKRKDRIIEGIILIEASTTCVEIIGFSITQGMRKRTLGGSPDLGESPVGIDSALPSGEKAKLRGKSG